MRFVLGFVSGVATAWAMLAIWQDLLPPPILKPDDDPSDRAPGPTSHHWT